MKHILLLSLGVIFVTAIGWFAHINHSEQIKPQFKHIELLNDINPGEYIIISKNGSIQPVLDIMYSGEKLCVVIDSTKVEILIEKFRDGKKY
jgi:preprotein translocase subunit YajC